MFDSLHNTDYDLSIYCEKKNSYELTGSGIKTCSLYSNVIMYK